MKFASRISRLHPSPVREILRAAGGRQVVSLAGGLPDPATFPSLVGLDAARAQYGLTEGDPDVRREISRHLQARGLECPPERILVLNGSQQGLDLAAKLLVEEGTRILCERPTYVAALQVFELFGGCLQGISVGRDGPSITDLREVFRQNSPTLAYVVPSFQNPTGVLWSDPSRDALARELDGNGECVLLEDDPYGELWWEAKPPAPVASRLRKAPWMYLGSFSKSFVPGLRMGFLACSESLFVPLERLKQASDLHSNRLAQGWVREDLQDPGRGERLERLRAQYRAKCDAFADSLARHFPESKFQTPKGGLFFWAQLAPGRDLRSIAKEALEAGVAFLPGEHCFPGIPDLGWARLNFSHASALDADRALSTLSKICRS
ncbi:MAG TPA: PLP-dependent aminotransferase family protein [Fibrobacteria bacterium]|nr:PLP-dependent aminotransferase family protein [Fibrobacteria bacterium]HOX52653.1 PLP-dependent aminotransferase family protein [Fibrobacteria bacterium]